MSRQHIHSCCVHVSLKSRHHLQARGTCGLGGLAGSRLLQVMPLQCTWWQCVTTHPGVSEPMCVNPYVCQTMRCGPPLLRSKHACWGPRNSPTPQKWPGYRAGCQPHSRLSTLSIFPLAASICPLPLSSGHAITMPSAAPAARQGTPQHTTTGAQRRVSPR